MTYWLFSMKEQYMILTAGFIPFFLSEIKCFKIRVLLDKILPYNNLLPSKEISYKIKKKGLNLISIY